MLDLFEVWILRQLLVYHLIALPSKVNSAIAETLQDFSFPFHGLLQDLLLKGPPLLSSLNNLNYF